MQSATATTTATAMAAGTLSAKAEVHLPRGLIFLASIWLIVSWMITMGLRTPVHPSSASFTPGVRLMVICVTIGLIIGWPLLRLSQQASAGPIRQTLLDLAVLLALMQVVLWPLRVVTIWSPEKTAAIDATIGIWLIIVGAIVAASTGTDRHGPRLLGMVACLGLCLLGPAAVWLGFARNDVTYQLIDLSPLLAVHTLGGTASARPTATDWQWIALLGAAGIMVWVALGMVTMIMARFGAADDAGGGGGERVESDRGDREGGTSSGDDELADRTVPHRAERAGG